MEIEHEERSVTGQTKGQHKNKSQVQTDYSQFTTRYDSETSAIWCWMHPEPRPCLNTTLIAAIRLLFSDRKAGALY